jgi:hypothetical protein
VTHVCGDGTTDSQEECDDGNTVTEDCIYGEESCTVCAADCTLQGGATSFCGDGITDPEEGCDDGNAVTEACDYGLEECTVCAADCTLQDGVAHVCGDGTTDLCFSSPSSFVAVATTIDFDQYAIAQGGAESTYNERDLSAIYSGDWIFEDVSTQDTGGLSAWGKEIEVISSDDANWTIVKLSHVDGINFSLNNFEYSARGAHTFKLVSDTGYEYQVSTDNSDSGQEGNPDQNILNSNFSDISYVLFYSRAITFDHPVYDGVVQTYTNWVLDDIELSTVTKWHLDDIELCSACVCL